MNFWPTQFYISILLYFKGLFNPLSNKIIWSHSLSTFKETKKKKKDGGIKKTWNNMKFKYVLLLIWSVI